MSKPTSNFVRGLLKELIIQFLMSLYLTGISLILNNYDGYSLFVGSIYIFFFFLVLRIIMVGLLTLIYKNNNRRKSIDENLIISTILLLVVLYFGLKGRASEWNLLLPLILSIVLSYVTVKLYNSVSHSRGKF